MAAIVRKVITIASFLASNSAASGSRRSTIYFEKLLDLLDLLTALLGMGEVLKEHY